MPKTINSEAQLTTFEAISMIMGNSIGTGIIAVPYLATRNSMLDVVWMVGLAYVVNVILHLIIAELSFNNGGVQLVKSFEGELFKGRMKKVFSWIMFVVYGLAIMIGVSGNINGGAQIFVNWFHMPLWVAQLIYYLIAGSGLYGAVFAYEMKKRGKKEGISCGISGRHRILLCTDGVRWQRLSGIFLRTSPCIMRVRMRIIICLTKRKRQIIYLKNSG